MKILGFYIGGHDSNIMIYDSETKFIKYSKSERYFGVKHHRANLSWLKDYINKYDFNPDVIVWTDGNRNNLGQCSSSQELYKKTTNNEINRVLGTNADCYIIDHHFGHGLSCWPLVDTDKVKYAFCSDGKGDHLDRFSIIKNPYEIIDEKYLEPGVLTKPENIIKIKSFCPSATLDHVGIAMKLYGAVIDMAGKVMGAYAYGDIKQDHVDKCLNSPVLKNGWTSIKDMSDEDFKPLDDLLYAHALCEGPYNLDNKEFVDYLTSNHYVVGKGVESLFLENVDDKDDVITYSGGTAQNTVWNEELFSNFKNLHIPPHPYDGGMSLGCVEFARILFKLDKMTLPNFPYVQDDEETSIPDESTIDKVVDMLVDGKIVGWFQGAGEIGPRALGNRSILMHPGLEKGKDIINERVKHREYWRPFAPSVLEEYAGEWFDLDVPSPYMLRAVTTKEDKRKIIPSVTHKDFSSRVQTVSKEQNLLYHTLIKKFYDKTGIPLVLNTSLNDGGQPIFSYRKQCVEFYNKVDIDAICIGSELHCKDT